MCVVEKLKEIFGAYGKIERCRLVRDIGAPSPMRLRVPPAVHTVVCFYHCVVSGRSKGYAFVEFKHRRDAESAFVVSRGVYIQRKTFAPWDFIQ